MLAEDPRSLLQAEFPASELGSLLLPHIGERPMVAPTDVEGFQRVLRMARQSKWTLQLAGNGSELGGGYSTREPDLVLSTRGYAGVLAFEPGDGTLSAKSGTSMQSLNEVTSAAGYELSPAVARPAQRSFGGVLGAGTSGIDRLQRGPLRHHVLGMGVLLADGSRAKTGGRLVKNVTGYDLQRLYSGSRGSLCLILEACLRLFPEPRQRAAVELPAMPRKEAIQAAQQITKEGIAPQAVVALPIGTDSLWQVHALLAGREEGVEKELSRLGELWPACEIEYGPGATESHTRWREALAFSPSKSGFELGTRPSQVNAMLADLERAMESLQAPYSMHCHPCLASLRLQFESKVSIEALTRLQEDLPPWATAMHWNPSGVAPAPARLGAVGVLMQRFKGALDPTGLFTGGDFDAKR